MITGTIFSESDIYDIANYPVCMHKGVKQSFCISVCWHEIRYHYFAESTHLINAYTT